MPEWHEKTKTEKKWKKYIEIFVFLGTFLNFFFRFKQEIIYSD